MTNPIDELIEKLLSSAKAFRENWIYTQDGDPVLLAVQAEELEQASSALSTLQERRDALFDAIQHGDQDHKDWLREAIAAHFAGEPVPAPRGAGNNEAMITSLQESNRKLEEALKPFADCVEQIGPEEDDEEWAKFRLLIGDYRRAARALLSGAGE